MHNLKTLKFCGDGVQFLSRVWLCDLWMAARQASLSFTISQSLLKLMSIESVMPSNHLVLCCPLLLLPSVSRLFTSGGLSIGALASASVLLMNIQGWFPLGLTGLIPLLSKGPSRVFSNTTVQKHQFCSARLSYGPTLTSMTSRKTVALTMWIFVSKVTSLLFNMLSRFFIGFLPRSKYLFKNVIAAVTVHRGH